MAEEVDCLFGGGRFAMQHPEVKDLRTTQLAEGTQNWCSSYRPQKFIISKGTADDKISRKFETLQRKLHVSKKQYLGQNESDKCVTWVEITLWIYQGDTVLFLLIVQMDPCFCCRWCERKKTSATSFLRARHHRTWDQTVPRIRVKIITGSFTMMISFPLSPERDWTR